MTGSCVDAELGGPTVCQWSQTWLDGYGTRRVSTVKTARRDLAKIVAEFGPLRLTEVRPSQVRWWCSKLSAEGAADSYVAALHARLSQIMSDAVKNGLIPCSPCSSRTAPWPRQTRAYVATTREIWQLHDATAERYRPAILLGAFAGLRVAEVSGLRVADIDFSHGIITPAVQYPALPLKRQGSFRAIPVPISLTIELGRHVLRHRAFTLLTNTRGQQAAPWSIESAFGKAKAQVAELPEGFRFDDLRHYYASILIGPDPL